MGCMCSFLIRACAKGDGILTQSLPEINSFDVLIHLDHGESTNALPTNEMVQVRHYQSLREQIKFHLDSLHFPTGSHAQRRHSFGSGWTHFIDGSRGAGKSTFLSSVKYALDSDDELKTACCSST